MTFEVSNSIKKTQLLFCWSGFPPYAASCIKHFCNRNPEINVQVICTRPSVPHKTLSGDFPAEVTEISENQYKKLDEIISGQPSLTFQTNYSIKAFRTVNNIMRKANTPVILASDHNWTGRFRQRAFDYIRHRLIYARMFQGVFVPGAAGRLYHEKMGYTADKIYEGLYGADPQIFYPSSHSSEKSKRFLYIGQMVERKNVLRLAEAFELAFGNRTEWKLTMCGVGPLASILEHKPNIEVLGFLDTFKVAELIRKCPVLILPSIKEHWGVVVHEAALSGACLALSREVGSARDLATSENSILFDPHCVKDIAAAMREVADWPTEQHDRASQVSTELAKHFGPETFSLRVEQIIRDYIL